MARGTLAKQEVVKKLMEAFGSDYIGESASKHYVWAKDGGEKVQIAISLTCPKTQLETVDVNAAFGDGIDFEAAPVVVQTKFEPAEQSAEELQNIADMMTRLGL